MLQDKAEKNPEIIGFACSYCTFKASEMAGSLRMKYPDGVKLVQVPCSSRVDPAFVIKAIFQPVPEIPATFRRLFAGETISLGEHSWRVIVGHGHAPEHASLYCERLQLLISGDMLLPRISTNVSLQPALPEGNPLGLFLDSIAALKALPADTLVLPSHGKPFRGLHRRVTELQEHHRDRCAELIKACATPQTAAELIPVLFPRDISDPHQTMFAMGEVIAHLNHLVAQGRLRPSEDGGVIRHRAVV